MNVKAGILNRVNKITQYSTIARRYRRGTKRSFNALKYKRLLEEDAELSRVDTILDVGCGEGTCTKFLKDEFEPGHIIGIDASGEMIDLAREEYSDIDFRNENMQELSLPSESVDFVFSRFAIHYSDSLEDTLREIARVTKKGGTFFLQDAHPFFSTFLKKSLDYEKKEDVSFKAQCDNTLNVVHPTFTFQEYIAAFTSAGWSLKSVREIYGRDSSDPKILPYRVPTSACFVLVKE